MKQIFTLLLVLTGMAGMAQTTIYTENVGTPVGTTLISAYTGWQAGAPIVYSSSATPAQSDVRTTSASTGYTGASGSGNVFLGTATGNARDFVISGINTTGFSAITLSFGINTNNIALFLTAEYSTDGGTSFNPIAFANPAATGWSLVTATTALPSVSNLQIRFSKNNAAQFRLDDITIKGTNAGGEAITTSGTLVAFAQTTASPSAEQSYTISGDNLQNQVAVTAPAGYEISTTSGSGFAASLNLAIDPNGDIIGEPLTIYVRLNASTTGAYAGNISNTSGTANSNVTVTGTYSKSFYSKATGNLDVLGTWGVNTDGSGATPVNFTDASQLFYVVNRASATIGAAWDVTGTGSKVIVGNGISATVLTIPATFAISTATRIDVTNASTLLIQNATRPFLNGLATGSTIDFAYAGTTTADTIRIPAIPYYNLKLTNGLKYLSGGTTTIRGNLTVDGVAGFNGNAPTFSTINAFGDVTFLNNAIVEPLPSGDAARITLAMNGSSGTQTISGNNPLGAIYLFRLRRDSVATSHNIVLGLGTNLSLGNVAGGGLQLTQGAATTTTLTLGANNLAIIGGGVVTPSALGKISSTVGAIGILKTTGNSNAGTLRFTPGSSLTQLGMNCVGFARDSIVLGDDVTVTTLLTLTKGKVVVPTGNLLTVLGSVVGGTDSSYVDGSLNKPVNAATTFQLGMNGKYAPVIVESTTGPNAYTARYFYSSFGNFAIDPATQALYPAYHVSAQEYWTVDRTAPGTANLTFYYTDANSIVTGPTSLRLAHFDGADWDDINGIPDAANTTSFGFVKAFGVTTFSPFTFSARVAGVVPVRLEYFRGQKALSGNLLNWKVNCLSTNITMEIEKSANGQQYLAIGSISATQARCATPFDFIDQQPIAGKNFYRIKMIDVDGKISYSPTVVLINANKGFVFAGLYPSVVNSNTSLNLVSAKATTVETVLTNAQGQVLRKNKYAVAEGNSAITIDYSNLAAGTYQLTGIAADGTTQTIRFVKH